MIVAFNGLKIAVQQGFIFVSHKIYILNVTIFCRQNAITLKGKKAGKCVVWAFVQYFWSQ